MSKPFLYSMLCHMACLMAATSSLAFGEEAANSRADLRVLIDVSGSMKQNDPNNLRRPAVELLVKLLPDDSRAGIWTFGRYVNLLVPHRDVDDAWRQEALQKAEQIDSTGLFTNIGETLEKAAYDYQQPASGFRTNLILLTDGMVDISREAEEDTAERRRIIEEILSDLKSSGYVLHTIALSDNADGELLQKLALTTDGIAAVARDADDLMRIFLEILNNAAPVERLPLDESGFTVDSSVQEFTALIFRKPGSDEVQLAGPAGRIYRFDEEDSYVNWYRAERYDLITVRQPLEGEWQVRADFEGDSRITVVSNLNLVVKPLRNNIFEGDSLTLSASLRDSGATITDAQFLNLLSIDYRIRLRNSDATWQSSLTQDTAPADGMFVVPLDMFRKAGTYDLTLTVDGKSFKREFSHSFAVREPFAVNVEEVIRDAAQHYDIRVQHLDTSVDAAQFKVTADIKTPTGSFRQQALAMDEDDDTWLLDFEPRDEGQYEIVLQVTEEGDSDSIRFQSEPLLISYGNAMSAAAPVQEAATPVQEIEPPTQSNPRAEAAPKAEPSKPSIPAAPKPADKGGNLWLYLGLGIGNLLILALAALAYKFIMGNRPDPELEELEKAVEAAKANPTEALATAETEAETSPSSPPSMADMDPQIDDAPLLDGSHDLVEDLGISEDTPAGGSTSAADLGAADVQFSLDDFSDDDLEDDKS